VTLVGISLLADAPAMAQSTVGEVDVVAPHVVREKAGKTYSGIPIEVVSLHRHVGYSDLDLTKAADVETFKQRIRDTAKDACAQLDELYPFAISPYDPGDTNCIREATEGALAQANLVMAAAAGK
jgi:UrcA family protein